MWPDDSEEAKHIFAPPFMAEKRQPHGSFGGGAGTRLEDGSRPKGRAMI